MAHFESFSGSSDYETDTSDDYEEESSSPIQVTQLPLTNSNKLESPKKKLLSDVESTDILNSMIDYQSQHNVCPIADIDSFLDYIKQCLNVDDNVTKKQLKDKIRRLKNKYDNNKREGMKPNGNAVFDLSEKVWGEDKKPKKVVALSGNGNGEKKPSRKRKVNENGNGNETVVETEEKVGALSVTRNGKKKPSKKRIGNEVETDEQVETVGTLSVTRNENESVVVRKNPSRKLKLDENGNKDDVLEKKAKGMVGNGLFMLSNVEKLLRIGAELFGGDEEVEGSENWRKLEREEMELSVKQLDVNIKKMRLVLDTME